MPLKSAVPVGRKVLRGSFPSSFPRRWNRDAGDEVPLDVGFDTGDCVCLL